MSESAEKKLYKYFKQRRFSELSFSYDEDSKNEDKSIVFNELEKILGSKSSAYLSLADLSTNIYDNHNFIVRSYIEHSLHFNPEDIKSLYAMHNLTYDPKYILEILNIHNKNNNIKELIQAIHNINYSILENIPDSEIDHWNLILEAYSKVDMSSNKLPISALALAYLKLNKIDLGLDLIKNNDLNQSNLHLCS